MAKGKRAGSAKGVLEPRSITSQARSMYALLPTPLKPVN